MFSIIIIIIVLIIVALIWFKIKHLKIGCLTFITGGIKTGKSSFTVHLGLKYYKKELFKWRIKCALCRLFRKKQPEKPLLYSNIPLKVPYVPLTNEILLRQERLAYKSVTIMDEASLVANSTLIKNNNINNSLSMFCKLYGHETRGGKCFISTHCVNDTHYAIKRVVDKYLHVVHSIKLPFFVLLEVRECIYSDDGSSVNMYSSDIDDTTLWCFYPKSIWKKFDAYSFSASTDNLKVAKKVKKAKTTKDLKTKELYSFNNDYIEHYNKGVNYETKDC